MKGFSDMEIDLRSLVLKMLKPKRLITQRETLEEENKRRGGNIIA